MTLPKISKLLGIYLSTAFYWRHKVLNALRSLGHDTLEGIVEYDETFFLESHKGRKSIAFRKPRKRGGVAKKCGISKEQVCVVVAIDRNGDNVSQNAGYGRITATEIDAVLGSELSPSASLITDSAKNYIAFAKMKGVHHEVVKYAKECTSVKAFTMSSTSIRITNGSRSGWNASRELRRSIWTTTCYGSSSWSGTSTCRRMKPKGHYCEMHRKGLTMIR